MRFCFKHFLYPKSERVFFDTLKSFFLHFIGLNCRFKQMEKRMNVVKFVFLSRGDFMDNYIFKICLESAFVFLNVISIPSLFHSTEKDKQSSRLFFWARWIYKEEFYSSSRGRGEGKYGPHMRIAQCAMIVLPSRAELLFIDSSPSRIS